MPRIRCHYLDCIFLDERYCSAAAIELNQDTGCLTYAPNEEAGAVDWEDEEELDEWNDMGSEEETEDLWGSDDEENDPDEDADEY